MNDNLRRLRLLSRKYDLSIFYVINIFRGNIYFQVDHSLELASQLKKFKCECKVQDSGYIEYIKGIYQVT